MKNYGDLYIKEGLRDVIAPDGELSVTFSVIVCRSKCINYEWFRNGVLIPGETHNVLRIYNINENSAGNYTVKAYNKKSCVKSCANLSVIVMIPKVYISTNSNKVLVYNGNTLELLYTIETAGTSLGIAFSKESVIITNTTGNVVTKANGNNSEISKQFDIGRKSKFVRILEINGKEMVAFANDDSNDISIIDIDLSSSVSIIAFNSSVTGIDSMGNKLLVTNENSSAISYVTLSEINGEIVPIIEEIDAQSNDLVNPSFSTEEIGFVQAGVNDLKQIKIIDGAIGLEMISSEPIKFSALPPPALQAAIILASQESPNETKLVQTDSDFIPMGTTNFISGTVKDMASTELDSFILTNDGEITGISLGQATNINPNIDSTAINSTDTNSFIVQ